MTDNLVGPGGAHALWIDRETIAWPTSLYPAHGQPTFRLRGHQDVVLRWGADFTTAQLNRFPHLRDNYRPLHVDLPEESVRKYLRGGLQLEAQVGNTVITRTSLQIAGVLDDLFGGAASEVLGTSWNDGVPTLRLWAPTAWHVALDLWTAGQKKTLLARADANGVWTVQGKRSWRDAEYLWNVSVYVPSENRIVTNRVTDPYSVGLTVDSKRSVLVDLDDPTWKPPNWGEETLPPLRNQSRQTIYELHVRDFSIADQSVPAPLRGTYKAFTCPGSSGVTHLRKLTEAGLTTLHLLPTFDFASVPEDRLQQKVPSIPADAGPASPAQQAAVEAVADVDGFNWGYDPFHWSTPEGSYATDGNQTGGARTLEFREMVASLHNLGLRVVLDQVYNHTFQAGQAGKSVLDKIVPGYYYRLSSDGEIETSTCCPNVATEHVMAEKMMIDSVLLWAEHYRVDGFRFDLMGHHSKETLLKVRNRLSDLSLTEHGVDGKAIYMYGEGWDFGEVTNDRLFVQARQGNLTETGIGAFNDRLRDAVRGGSPLDYHYDQHQGFGTGLANDPNSFAPRPSREDLQGRLGYYTDLIRLGLAGNLRGFPAGESADLGRLEYNGQRAAFAAEPQENVNYVDAHDDLTLFDVSIFKLPQDTTLDARVRMNTLSLATVMLGQSPAFWHAGTEILRSKSLDRNSFNSGDHFNAVDWTLETTNFAGGLPMANENQERWAQMSPLLQDPTVTPTSVARIAAFEAALDLLRIRSSTPLITLGNAERIKRCVTFPAIDAQTKPGLLVMLIEDNDNIDDHFSAALIVFNASPEWYEQRIPGLGGRALSLHPVQQAGFDDIVRETKWEAREGVVAVPPRSVAVLVEPRN